MKGWPVATSLCLCLACGGGDSGLSSQPSPTHPDAMTPQFVGDAALAGHAGAPEAGSRDGGSFNGGSSNGGAADGGARGDGGDPWQDAARDPEIEDAGDSGADTQRHSDAGDVDASTSELDAAVSDVPDAGVSEAGVSDAGDGADSGTAQIVAPRNVIFLMADGYGAEQIKATRIYVNGNTAPLSFETLPHQAWVATNNARNQTTDSAAAATAFATGHKVDQSVVSMAIPGSGSDLTTALEVQKARGKRIGLVTTHTAITDASPACFGAHAVSRGNTAAIAASYFSDTRPNVLFGLTDVGITEAAAQAAGYTVVTNAAELVALDLDTETHISGQFTEGTLPPLKDLALAALDVVEQSSEGFFLFVEQEQTDSGGHANNLSLVITAAIEFDAMVEQVLAWAQGREDTLIVVGADHETGGLVLNEPNPTQGVVPDHSYANTGHSSANVRFFASGVGSERMSGTLDNTEVFPLLAGYQVAQCAASAACVAGAQYDVLHAATPNTAAASGTTLTADLNDGGFAVQSLLAFTELSDLLAAGCVLRTAHLVLPVSNGSTDGIRLHRMLSNWSTSSTWNSFGGNGIQANDSEASVVADAQSGATSPGVLTFNVTSAVTTWLSNPSSNYGWVLMANGSDGMDVASPSNSTPPQLRLFCD